MSSLLPRGSCLYFLSRIGFSIPIARRFSSNAANSRSRAFPLFIFLCKKKSLRTSMHSVRLEPTKLVLIGTRTHLTCGILYLVLLLLRITGGRSNQDPSPVTFTKFVYIPSAFQYFYWACLVLITRFPSNTWYQGRNYSRTRYVVRSFPRKRGQRRYVSACVHALE